MKCILLLALMFSVSVAWGEGYGTYQDANGDIKRLKNLNGEDHAYTGRIRPGIDLYGVDLRNANLFRANLRGVDLTEANLSGAYLRESLLDGAILNGTNFEGANINFASISRIGLSAEEPTVTNFRKVNMSGTIFRHMIGWGKADWQGAIFEKNYPPICPPNIVPQEYGILPYSPEVKRSRLRE